jgi:hypothetical protein
LINLDSNNCIHSLLFQLGKTVIANVFETELTTHRSTSCGLIVIFAVFVVARPNNFFGKNVVLVPHMFASVVFTTTGADVRMYAK